MNIEAANKFATEWIQAWNSHDLGAILNHYEDDFEMSSPMIIKHENLPSGTLKGKDNVKRYWEGALRRSPDLHFELLHVLLGSHSITVIYDGVRGLSAEVFHFSENGKVSSAYAHYKL